MMDNLKQLQEQHDYFKNGMAELQDYIDKMDPKIKQLQQELEQMKLLAKTGADALIATANDGLELVSQNEALAAQVEQLREVINYYQQGQVPSDEAMNELIFRVEKTPTQCLAERDARVAATAYMQGIDDYNAAEQHYENFDIESRAEEYANQLRQAAKGGK